MAESLSFTGGKKLVVGGQTFTVSPAQLSFEPNSTLHGFQSGAELDLQPAVFQQILTYLSGYTLTSVVAVPGLSQQDTTAALRRDADRLGLSKLVELLDSLRGSRKPPAARPRSISDAPPVGPEELAKGVYIRGVQRDLQKPHLAEALAAYGTIVSSRVVHSKRCAFVDFETEASAKAAIDASAASNGIEINGIRVKIDARQPSTRKPRSPRLANGLADKTGKVINEAEEEEEGEYVEEQGQ